MGMIELVECGGYVARHREFCSSVFVVPRYADATIEKYTQSREMPS